MRYRFLRFPGGKPKAVTFSYDDGMRHDIRHAETLNRYGMKCTYNINSGMMGQHEDSRRMMASEIQKYILDAGHEVAIHGDQHIASGSVSSVVGIRDALNCRLALENEFGCIIRGMAFPDSGITRFHNGTTKEQVKKYLKDLGIVYARTLGGDNDKFELPQDFLEWMPTVHNRNPKVYEYIDEFLEIDYTSSKMYVMRSWPKLFYMWGHSFEFGDNDDWQHWETICKKLANKEDIWYATNIEIYEYVEAYQSLVFSADETIAYNPTLKTIWFEVDRKPYSIEPGETLKIL